MPGTPAESRIECPWTLGSEALGSQLGTDAARGLAAAEARRRLDRFGPNQLQETKTAGPLALFLDQFKDFLIWVLIGAALVSGVLKEWVDALAIVGIVLLNAVMGFVQEFRAEKSLAALRRMASAMARVVRDGRAAVVPTTELVPGDLVELEAGDHVPADGRIVSHTANFRVQEASLTGESVPVAKQQGALGAGDVPLGDRTNMAFMGTSVVSGRARALLVATGMATELGRIAGMIQAIDSEPTPLQRKLDAFGKLIVKIAFALVVLVFSLEMARGGRLVEVLLTAVSLAVAAIPEGLPAVVTIALALGVHRMVKRHALIRKLPSVETLGCATVICSDKTGTLTRNEMTVQAVYAGDRRYDVTGSGYAPRGEFLFGGQAVPPDAGGDLGVCLACGVLCNSAQLHEEKGVHRIVGDPTEGALLTCAAKMGLWKAQMEESHPYVEELPFDSERKKMSVVRRTPGGGLAVYVKGAPDILLADCRELLVDGRRRPLAQADRDAIQRVNAGLADEAMRVLAVAYRDLDVMPTAFEAGALERDLVFAGLVAMLDPPREEARAAVRRCRSAGVRTVMITGDHKNTAVAVARDLGMYGDGSLALTGAELDRWDDARLAGEVERVTVYARVSPEHKLRVVRCWRQRGHIVAMTGDGVNDAPAVKEADIGVAMGITGTDVTKEVSDMVVTDDNFASIVAAVEEGRGIYDNILKFVHYLLSCNTGEILVMLLSSLMGLPTPLLPIHILWVNLVTDGLPALALGVDPVNPGIMRRRPRDPAEPVVGRRDAAIMIAQGFFIAACTLAAFALVLYVEGGTLAQARTEAFIVLSLSQLFHAFNCRSRIDSIFTLGVFSNAKLVLAALVSGGLQLLVTCVPFLMPIFKTQPLGAADWTAAAALASFPLWAMEGVKWVLRRVQAAGGEQAEEGA
jgi:P-type Ca2+ transporter type 2C